jgi:hypothetical protein
MDLIIEIAGWFAVFIGPFAALLYVAHRRDWDQTAVTSCFVAGGVWWVVGIVYLLGRPT